MLHTPRPHIPDLQAAGISAAPAARTRRAHAPARCGRCGGQLFDEGEWDGVREYACLQCGARAYDRLIRFRAA